MVQEELHGTKDAEMTFHHSWILPSGHVFHLAGRTQRADDTPGRRQGCLVSPRRAGGETTGQDAWIAISDPGKVRHTFRAQLD
ncbi:Hypp3267 [Branchiostoma lanceolatum]|uniref:Hypp3267 protein n=1 Tax=Branchiostoma lanceolatum TaxID=7740 RepID=A0A8K0A0W7_BRALA|nr:Hypp3267 [Branchiostoma lanceolatum]